MNKILLFLSFLILGCFVSPRDVYAFAGGSDLSDVADIASLLNDSVLAPLVSEYLSCCLPLDDVAVTSGYGYRTDPFTGHRTLHNGLDLRASFQDVYAMMSGSVVAVGQDARSGCYVTIRHCGFTVSYCHLSRVLVSRGDNVVPGQVVAVSGNSGRSTAPHLHITCRYLGSYIDPQLMLSYIRQVRMDALHRIRILLSAAPSA